MIEHLYDYDIFQEKEINSIAVLLETNLKAFSQITNVPVSYFSVEGKYEWSTLPEKRLCISNKHFGSDDMSCTKTLLSAMHTSLSLSDVYMFICFTGMLNFCCPIRIEGKIYGFLMGGPVPMGKNLKRLYADFIEKSSEEPIDYTILMPLMHETKLYSPQEINSLSILFQNTIYGSLGPQKTISVEEHRNREMSELGRKLNELGKEKDNLEYPYELENILVKAVNTGNTEQAENAFGKYIEMINLLETGKLSIIKLRVISLITQLMRSHPERSKDYNNIYLLEQINDAEYLSQIRRHGYMLICGFAASISEEQYSGSSSIVKEAVSYVNIHYSENITLKSTAEAIHVNHTYLSTLFKKEFGQSFISYLNEIRLENARKLLRTTALPVTDICMETGFTAPSYFAKVFREKYGMTPKEYRNEKGTVIIS